MIVQSEQSELIKGIAAADGFAFEKFTSAAGIMGNFKISLPEALSKDEQTLRQFVGHMAAELTGVDVIAATGGAVMLGREVSAYTGQPFIEIKRYPNNPGCYYPDEIGGRDMLKMQPRIGFVEDVTSTRQTVEQAIHKTQIGGMVDKVVAGWRRGDTAPDDMTLEEINQHNRDFNFRDLYEVPSNFPFTAVVERKIPLWVPLPAQIVAYIPELEEV